MSPRIVSLNQKLGIDRYLSLDAYQQWELLLTAFDTVVDVLKSRLDGPNMNRLI
jgi:hypothetical protein